MTYFDELRKSLRIYRRDHQGRFARIGSGNIHITPTYGGQWRGTDDHGNLVVRPTYSGVHEELSRRGQLDVNDPRQAPYGGKDPAIVASVRSRILSGQPSTRDLYSREIAGERVYDAKRKKVHDDIVQAMLRMHDGKPDKNGAERQRPVGRKPQVFFTGGGYAAGKGGVVDFMNGGKGHPWKPQEDPVIMDPDKIKSMIPEFKQLQREGDPEANLRVYEEAWDIAMEVQRQTRDNGLDAIVDGVGDTSADAAISRAQDFINSGYDTPKGVYVTSPIDVAIHNARMRMEGAIKSGKLESIRYVPEDLLADTHAKVSEEFPEILRRWPGELELYDTNTWNPTRKAFDDPRLILKKHADGHVETLDEQAYQAFLVKKRYVGGA